MNTSRPDLTGVPPMVVAYIESLEAELERLAAHRSALRAGPELEPSEPSEPPTTLNVVTISSRGMAKRTPRHLYGRQRRGGMGVFDLETPDTDAPAFLTVADESASLLLLTSRARVFRLPVSTLAEAPVRARGTSLDDRIGLIAGETLNCVTPLGSGSYLTLVSDRGQIRRYGSHLFGENMRPGTALYDVQETGAPAAVCWSTGEADMLIVTRLGNAIRFAEKQIPVRGCLGIRLDRHDAVAAVAPVDDSSAVFLLSNDGKGTLRQISGFRANKAPGSGGKAIMKTDALVAAAPATDADDIFIISRLGKIIRFQAVEVPAKEGLVQGVNCMELRADETVSLVVTR